MNASAAPFLMIDDERFPPSDGNAWVLVRTVAEAVRWIKAHGVPAHIAFDNDLQRRLEGRHLAQWMIRVDMEQRGTFIPAGFTFYVHSQNAVNGTKALLNHHLEGREALLQRLDALPKHGPRP